MRIRATAKIFITMLLLTVLTISVGHAAASKEEQRQHIRDITQVTLSKLYGLQPEAQTQIEKAAGYAVFGNWSVKIMLIGSAQGKGMAVNNINKQETFMKMMEKSVGFGVGATTYNVVFVFDTEDALNDFTNNGWQFSGEVKAAATDGVNGDSYQGAALVSPGIWLYYMTDKGIAFEVSIKGAKFIKNDLN